MVRHILIKILLVLCIVRTMFALTKIGKYRQNSTMNGKLCELASLDFGLLRKVSMCAAKCRETENCKSFFYNKQTTLCKGAPELISVTSVCQDAAYTGYYEDITFMTGLYGANCTNWYPCGIANSLCLRGQCSCQPGYKYDRSTGLCLTDCSVYGNTYIGYYDMKFDDPSIIKSFNGITLTLCKTYCSERIDCRSFGYQKSTGLCRLKATTVYDQPEAYSSLQGVDYYNRNCE